MSRVVVVGAGVGGLAAAARLAALGHDVTVCEQAETVGGKLGWERIEGFGFDTGPSLITLPQAFEELFADTGDRLPTVLPLERTTLPRARFADGQVMPTATTAREFLDGLEHGQAQQWSALMTRAKAIWEATEQPFLRSPIGSPAALARLLARQTRDLRTVAPRRTLRDVAATYLTDPHLRTVLDRYATYSGSDPRKVPAALAVVPYVEQAFGAWHIPGGLHRLGDAIRDRAIERGATLRLSTAVTSVTTHGRRVSGVTLADGGELPADVVVANADAAHLYGELLPRPRLARRATRRASYAGFVVLLGVRGAYHRLAHHEVFFPADYDLEFDQLAAGELLSDPTIYLSRPTDATLAPAGHEAWFLLVNAPRQDQLDWTDDLSSGYAGTLLDLLADRGLDVRDRVAVRRWLTPRDLERRTRASGGAIYGTSSNGIRSAFLRPPNEGPVRGLFLVGGASHPGGGLPLVMLSAAIVAGLVGSA